ncbi:hypothetical protein [Anabaena catenula]|uniref:Uncharacterized protein n=1 Tax=Anabaena catenula FACHB-362 TaxID=2692877 RepID=A0ABR8J093_9NOST|nr:hypothetical protein [Anabaena catenula]MBD2691275.1 hypothetical protein [Anabaena catenula FACHB-362]
MRSPFRNKLGEQSLFGDVGERSRLWMWGSAIAQALTCQFAVWGCWECDRCLRMWVGMRSLK